MNALTATEAAALRTAAEAAMLDTCQLGTVSNAADDTYEGAETVTYATAISCRFVAQRGAEGAGSEAVINDAMVRLPFATAATSVKRVKLVSRFGTALGTPETYRILGGPLTGPTAVTLKLKALPAGGVG